MPPGIQTACVGGTIQTLWSLAHEKLGDVKVAGVVPKLSRTPGRLHQSGGAVGRDTERVLRELGLSDEQVERLVEAGIVKCAPAGPAEAATNA